MTDTGKRIGRILRGTSLMCKSKMEEICASIFGPTSLSSGRDRSNFICGPTEKSAVLTVATLLARNVFHIGGTVAVPQKCRLTQIGKLNCALVCMCVHLCVRGGA